MYIKKAYSGHSKVSFILISGVSFKRGSTVVIYHVDSGPEESPSL